MDELLRVVDPDGDRLDLDEFRRDDGTPSVSVAVSQDGRAYVPVHLDAVAVAEVIETLQAWLGKQSVAEVIELPRAAAMAAHPSSRTRPDLEADGYGWPTVAPVAADPEPPTILEEAQHAVYGDRQEDYGHPREDFTRTAILWTGLLQHKLADGAYVEAEDIARCMIGVKLARDVHGAKRDNRVDMAGYALTLDRLETGR